VAEPQSPGVQELAHHQGLQAFDLGQSTDMPFHEGGKR
jgi:hypothetical protein